MAKPMTNYVVDVLMAISFFGVAITGIMKWPGWFKGASWNWFLLRQIHDWAGIIMAGLVLLHLILHWQWIVVMTKKVLGK